MRAKRGVSVLDVVIVVVIIAALGGLASGGYDYAVRMHRRGAAQDCLRAAAEAMQRAHAMTSTYQGAAIPSCPASVAQYYTDPAFAAGPSDDAYTLQIAPRPGTDQAKDACGRMTIDETGRRGADDDQLCW